MEVALSFRSRYLPRTRTGWIAVLAFLGRIFFEMGTLLLMIVAGGGPDGGGEAQSRVLGRTWSRVSRMYVAVWAGALVLSHRLFGGPLALWRRVATELPDLLPLPGPEGFFTPT